MNVVFVGGGSFRTLPIVRAAMSDRKVLRDGKIWLVDFNLARAETVGKLIKRTPEFAGSGCEVEWTDKLEKALPGADIVSISFPVGSAKVCRLSVDASHKLGFHASDQLSLSGAFRSLTGGRIILDIARRMERLCPKAWLVSHANPVAVYSGMVNNHTRIRALGLCGSCYHPRWDLTRLLFEKDEFRDGYTYASAGVNHMTLLLRCKYKGRDVYKMLDEKYGDRPWKPRLKTIFGSNREMLYFSYSLMRKMRRSFGIMNCSNEIEGPWHIFPEEYGESWTRSKPASAAELRLMERNLAEARAKADAEFRSHLDKELDASFWARPSTESRNFGAAYGDPTAVVIKALSGSPQWLAASLPSNGAIKGFKDRTVVDYSFSMDKDGVHPDPDLEIPDCLHGIISSLASHQTLLGDAAATRDPQILAEALFAYPHHRSMKDARSLWKILLKIHAAEIAPEFQKAADYF